MRCKSEHNPLVHPKLSYISHFFKNFVVKHFAVSGIFGILKFAVSGIFGNKPFDKPLFNLFGALFREHGYHICPII